MTVMKEGNVTIKYALSSIQRVDTIAGKLLVPGGIIRPVVNVSVLTLVYLIYSCFKFPVRK
jgi:hypothetical protein